MVSARCVSPVCTAAALLGQCATCAVGCFCGGLRGWVCEWCRLAVVWVDCSVALFYCVPAFLGSARPLQLSPCNAEDKTCPTCRCASPCECRVCSRDRSRFQYTLHGKCHTLPFHDACQGICIARQVLASPVEGVLRVCERTFVLFSELRVGLRDFVCTVCASLMWAYRGLLGYRWHHADSCNRVHC